MGVPITYVNVSTSGRDSNRKEFINGWQSQLQRCMYQPVVEPITEMNISAYGRANHRGECINQW